MFKLEYINGSPVIACDTDEEFRTGLAQEAMTAIDHLLYMLKREHGEYGFQSVFTATVDRVRKLTDAAADAVLPVSRQRRDSQQLADVVFGEEWLIGWIDSDGNVHIKDGSEPSEAQIDEAPAGGVTHVDGAATWDELNRDEASAAMVECRADSGSDVNAGARFARSMLRAIKKAEGGESTGPGDDETEPFNYGAMGLAIQPYLAAAAIDAKSVDFMLGFTMALAVYLHAPCFGGGTWAYDLLTWDPVEELEHAGICSVEKNPPAKVVRKRASRSTAVAA